MIRETEAITEDLLALPRKVRASLACSLIRSLDERTDPNAEQAWKYVIQRRYRLFKKNRTRGRPLEQVLADLRAKLR
jgi:hypothetical protein